MGLILAQILLFHAVFVYPNEDLTQERKKTEYEERQDAFIVRIEIGGGSCTASMIAEDWLITAQHCVDNSGLNFADTNEHGDKILQIDRDSELHTALVIQRPSKNDRTKVENWRHVQTIILRPGFEGQALSWKGNDLALFKLYPEEAKKKTEFVALKPLCLPQPKSKPPEHLLVSGFGQRRFPHCITDDQGPEKFGICGRPVECSSDHRARKCGLKFLYQGELHTECLTSPNPSMKSKICKDLYQMLDKNGEKADAESKTIHILTEDLSSLVTTCYPDSPERATKGWCTVRDQGIDDNKEPEADSGWGYCSSDHDQEECNKLVTQVLDISITRVNILDRKYCIDKLMDNLNVEQPDVKVDDLENLPKQFCIGRKKEVPLDTKLFYRQNTLKGSPFLKIEKSNENVKEQMKKILEKANPDNTETIDGGPNCFGDSGGPIFRVSEKNETIIEGVYSYMLWGTCRGRKEPSYVMELSHLHDWIFQNVPEKDICVEK